MAKKRINAIGDHNDMRRAAIIRGKIAEADLRIYVVATAAGFHPAYLSAMLHGRSTLTEAAAVRVEKAIEDLQRTQA